jgi:hypothetical protein
MRGGISVFTSLFFFAATQAAPPPTLPGEDITNRVGAAAMAPDTGATAAPSASPQSASWLDQAMKTWDAPPLSRQMSEDAKIVPLGKGGIFIPRFSDPALEPTIQINNPAGKLVAWGETGKKYAMEPGEYSVVLGSGAMNLRIVKKISVGEGKVEPLFPDWCGLSIDVVDENNQPFRGAYEMARLDTFAAFGRSYGREMTRGERVKTWILKPGLYKIFSAGRSYNTLTNFITVRLIPGEFVRVVVIENDVKDVKILGGGVVNVSAPSSQVSSDWKHNLNVGGTIMLNATTDKITPHNTDNLTDIAFLTLFDLNYKKGSVDWENNVFLKEGFNFSDLNLSDIANVDMADDFRITSLAVWRVILPWLGPYCRTEVRMRLLPLYRSFDKRDPNHFFIVLNSDSSIQEIDSLNRSKILQPVLSHLSGDAGVGTNIDMITRDDYEAKLRLGLGYSRDMVWSQKNETDSTAIGFDKMDTVQSKFVRKILDRNFKVLRHTSFMSQSYGPEFGLAVNFRAGGWGVARGDFRMRIPIDHYRHPDWDIDATLSWMLTGSVTLDYIFLYTYKHPNNSLAWVNKWTNSIFLRFSLSSR